MRQTLEDHSDYVNAVAFSPDGKLLASASGDGNVATGRVRRTLVGHSDYVNAVAFSPDGKLLASASGDRTVRLWDTTTGAACQTLEGHSHYVNAVALLPDCKLLASASDDRTVRLWDAADQCARCLKLTQGSIPCFAHLPKRFQNWHPSASAFIAVLNPLWPPFTQSEKYEVSGLPSAASRQQGG